MSTFSASLTSLTVLPPQSRDCSCYVSRPILAPPPLWWQKHTDLRAYDCAHLPDLWHQPRLANITYAWSWRLCGITPAIQFWHISDSKYASIRYCCRTSQVFFPHQLSLSFPPFAQATQPRRRNPTVRQPHIILHTTAVADNSLSCTQEITRKQNRIWKTLRRI